MVLLQSYNMHLFNIIYLCYIYLICIYAFIYPLFKCLPLKLKAFLPEKNYFNKGFIYSIIYLCK